MMKKTQESNVLDLECKFGAVSFDARASVQLLFEKETFKAAKVEELFCGRRLDVKLKAANNDEDSDQQHFDGMESYSEVEGSCDANRYQSAPDRWGTKLYFNLKDVDELDFLHLRKRRGRILIRAVAEIPDDEPKGNDDLPGQKTLEGSDLDSSITQLSLGAGPEKILTDAKLTTIRKLTEFMRETGLSAIKGVGKQTAERINERLITWYSEHPDAAEGLSPINENDKAAADEESDEEDEVDEE